MSRRNLVDGKWFTVQNEQQHENLKSCGRLTYDSFWSARVRIGKYQGPGRYLVLSYQQRCPRNCCDDSVCEVIPAADITDMAKEKIKELVDLIKEARK